MFYNTGATSNTLTVQIVDDTGLEVTGLVAATWPATKYVLTGPNASVAFPTITDLAAITTAFSAGGLKEYSNGFYRLDAPDAAFAVAGQVRILAGVSGKHLLCPEIIVGALAVDYQQRNVAVTLPTNLANSVSGIYSGTVTGSPTTTGFVDTAQTGGTNVWKGRTIVFYGSASIAGQAVAITGYVSATHTYSFNNLPAAPATTDTYVII